MSSVVKSMKIGNHDLLDVIIYFIIYLVHRPRILGVIFLQPLSPAVLAASCSISEKVKRCSFWSLVSRRVGEEAAEVAGFCQLGSLGGKKSDFAAKPELVECSLRKVVELLERYFSA